MKPEKVQDDFDTRRWHFRMLGVDTTNSKLLASVTREYFYCLQRLETMLGYFSQSELPV